jgi:hypothetical protein
VLPVVLYKGIQTWNEFGRMVDLVAGGELFTDVVPEFRPLFVNLPALPAERLESEGGPFGWVLELIQQRHARPEEFRRLLARAVDHINSLAAKERERWLELLSYIQSLVYHDRDKDEREELRELIVASVRTDDQRKDIEMTGQTGAEFLMDEGRKQGAVTATQEMLLRLMRTRFRKVPRDVVKVIRSTNDVTRL